MAAEEGGKGGNGGTFAVPDVGDRSWLNSYVKDKSERMMRNSVTGNPMHPTRESTVREEKVAKALLDGDAQDDLGTPRSSRSSRTSQKLHVQSNLILKLFGSNEATDEAQLKTQAVEQHWMNKYVFHPEATARRNWDMIAICLVVYTVFVLPTRTAFLWQKWNENPEDSRKWDSWGAMDAIIDGFFLLDVIFNFFTGYYETVDEDVVIMNAPDIALHYFTGWLLLDVLATIPLDQMMGSDRTVLNLPRLFLALRLSRLLRLLRLSRMLRYVKRVRLLENTHISPFQVRLVKLFCTEITSLHWSACAQWLVVAVSNFPENSWAIRQDLVYKSIFDQYSWSLFRALSHMLCIGYGQEPPYTLVDAWTSNISMLGGASLFAVFVGIVTSLLIQLDGGAAVYQAKLELANHYMAYRRLPPNLRQRIRDNYEFRWGTQKAFDEQSILQGLPVSLRTEVAIHNCQDLLEMVPFFMDCEKGLISSIVTLLQPSVFLNGEIIIREGETSKGMFFIRYGEVQVSTDDQIITYLTKGSFFGEIGNVKGSHRTADVSTTKDCELYYLSKEDYHEVFDSFPEAADTMAKIADHRLTALQWYKEQVKIEEQKEDNLHKEINPAVGAWRNVRRSIEEPKAPRPIRLSTFGANPSTQRSRYSGEYEKMQNEEPITRPPTAFEIMLEQESGQGVLQDLGIESRNIDLEGAHKVVRAASEDLGDFNQGGKYGGAGGTRWKTALKMTRQMRVSRLKDSLEKLKKKEALAEGELTEELRDEQRN
eukprot:CAMPEP_0198200488 /NCGR_PEP_ID=MMETSP1445-20131203/3492_1 /TAXON_ID=36898 /ORGANISM="Pyramimonas sp., Strain CCMP2087" /LENGTH=764 /DNA_ID=CAMNT_0043870575 /DNA_START=373 /DNA_END=2667 /DNA_ORIENTATION=-